MNSAHEFSIALETSLGNIYVTAVLLNKMETPDAPVPNTILHNILKLVLWTKIIVKQ